MNNRIVIQLQSSLNSGSGMEGLAGAAASVPRVRELSDAREKHLGSNNMQPGNLQSYQNNPGQKKKGKLNRDS